MQRTKIELSMLATTSSSAIIGSTGFVGSNLRASHNFNDNFNSRNIAQISGKSYDLVVCAAAPATMWAANKNPEGDLQNIRTLVASLKGIKAHRFVLISTIAVLADAAAGLDEDA
jgi:nucleoside-diphosphate-sugar epimerase